MPRFFFHVTNQTGVTHDREGRELADADAARDEAARAATDILGEEVETGRNDVDLQVAVEAEGGHAVLTLHVTARVERPAG